jgi:DNA phosphorothioation-dependent restriction protein DptG
MVGKGSKQGDAHKKVILKYEAEEKEVARLLKSYVGEAVSPGTTYNIQNAFHSQGYFGVKVTPLWSNLALLEDQEEGEVEALMEDAKGWLDQWFSAIRPWRPKDVDKDRII